MGGSQSNQTQSSGPPQALWGPLNYGLQQAQQLYQSPSPQYYPGTTVAAQSPATQAGQQAAIALGTGGSPVQNAGTSYLGNVLGGNYLNSANLDPVHQAITASVLPSIAGQFESAGRYGSPAQAGTEATALANAFAPYDFGQYQAERGMQQQAAQMAPAYQGMQLNQIGALGGAGQSQDVQAQNLINADQQRWNYNQNLANQKLSQYMGMLMQPGWGTQGTATTKQPTDWLSLIGGIAGGLL